MNTPTVLIGVVATLFGMSTIILRHTHPHWFKKFGPMKKQWGEQTGYIIHFVGYSLVLLAFGITMIVIGINGGSFFAQ